MKKKLIGLGLIIVLALFINQVAIIISDAGITLNNRLTTAKKEVSIAKNKYNQSVDDYVTAWLSTGKTFEDAKMQSLSDRLTAYSVSNNAVQSFFKVYYTFTDADSYNTRKTKLGALASESVLNNDYYFGNPVDNSGENYITVLGLKNKFVSVNVNLVSYDENNVQILAVAVYKSKTNSTSYKNGSQMYMINYNRKENKIDSLDKVNNSINNTYTN